MRKDPKPADLDYAHLNDVVDAVASSMQYERQRLIPYLRQMREILHAEGTRTDLRPADAPTWGQWLESKREALDMAPRTVELLLETGGTKRKPLATVARGPKAKPTANVTLLECGWDKRKKAAVIELVFTEQGSTSPDNTASQMHRSPTFTEFCKPNAAAPTPAVMRVCAH